MCTAISHAYLRTRCAGGCAWGWRHCHGLRHVRPALWRPPCVHCLPQGVHQHPRGTRGDGGGQERALRVHPVCCSETGAPALCARPSSTETRLLILSLRRLDCVSPLTHHIFSISFLSIPIYSAYSPLCTFKKHGKSNHYTSTATCHTYSVSGVS